MKIKHLPPMDKIVPMFQHHVSDHDIKKWIELHFYEFSPEEQKLYRHDPQAWLSSAKKIADLSTSIEDAYDENPAEELKNILRPHVEAGISNLAQKVGSKLADLITDKQTISSSPKTETPKKEAPKKSNPAKPHGTGFLGSDE